MYWRGHVGIALLAYAPVAGAVRLAGEPELSVLGAVVAVAFATLPDLDHRLPVAHRGPTHTIAFALAAGVLVSTAAAVAFATSHGTALPAGGETALPPLTPAFVGGVATLSIGSHVAGDAITPMGIWPLRPFREWHLTLDLTPAANPRANRLFLGAGVAALTLSVGLTP
ncbi:metal-dependent hydrolase [Halorubrum sp. N11]|uniref:metal-dependent hydrolase n=1 Tax=Halorubrum sp. N11 TaxID=3402276 RepID=UPI003EBFF5CB